MIVKVKEWLGELKRKWDRMFEQEVTYEICGKIYIVTLQDMTWIDELDCTYEIPCFVCEKCRNARGGEW